MAGILPVPCLRGCAGEGGTMTGNRLGYPARREPTQSLTGAPESLPPDGALVTPDAAPVRTCSRCKQPMPPAAFRRDSRGYVRSHCNPCALAATQQWRAHHREALLARRRAAYAARLAEPGGEKTEGAASNRSFSSCVPTPGGTHTDVSTLRKTAPSLFVRAAGFPTPSDGGETP